jgi:F-type H+-transporting ATPase subunit delta
MDRPLINTWAAGILAHAKDCGCQTRWSSTLSMLDNIVANPAFARVAFQTNLSHKDLAELVLEVCKGMLGPEETNLVRLLCDHGRLGQIGRIRRRYEEMREHEAGIMHVLLISAVPLDPEAWERILPALQRHFGPGMRPHFHVDPELMGGLVVRSGDQVLDVSARNRLARLARAIHS